MHAVIPEDISPLSRIGEPNTRKSVVQFKEGRFDGIDHRIEIGILYVIERGYLQNDAQEVAPFIIAVGFQDNVFNAISNGRIVSNIFNAFLEYGKICLLHLST